MLITNTANKQKGLATLTVTTLILIILTLVTIYAARFKMTEMRVAQNDIRAREAFAAAEAGLSMGLSMLEQEKTWNGTQNGTNYSVSATNTSVTLPDWGTGTLYTLTSTGSSDDGSGSSQLSQQGLVFPIVRSAPDTPLTVKGTMDISGSFTVVANPNGGGTGVPLSVWSDSLVDMTNGSGQTCNQQEYSDGNCSSDPISSPGDKGIDILDQDADFPSDLLEYTFGVTEANWQTVKDMAETQLTDCTSLGTSSSGLIWVDGACTVNSNTVVGSQSSPVILMVTDGDLQLNGGAEIYGMVFSFKKPSAAVDYEINMTGSAIVHGAVMTNHDVGHSSGTLNAKYDASALENIVSGDAFQRVQIIPGSWRDF